jgi:hypothetical protein
MKSTKLKTPVSEFLAELVKKYGITGEEKAVLDNIFKWHDNRKKRVQVLIDAKMYFDREGELVELRKAFAEIVKENERLKIENIKK